MIKRAIDEINDSREKFHEALRKVNNAVLSLFGKIPFRLETQLFQSLVRIITSCDIIILELQFITRILEGLVKKIGGDLDDGGAD